MLECCKSLMILQLLNKVLEGGIEAMNDGYGFLV